MRRGLLLLSLLCGCSQQPLARQELAIVNGDASSGHPAVVALRSRREICPEGHEVETFCSGVLVSERAVVTAAHCLANRRAEEIEIFFGDDVHASGRFARVVSATTHPAYDADSRANDLAVLSIVGGPAPVPLSRGPSGSLVAGDEVTLVGFGAPSAGADTGNKREGIAKLTVLDALTMSLEPGPAVSCGGDSGGAVLASGKLVAVIRSGDSTCRAYTIATRIDAYEDSFLARAIADASSAPAPSIGDPSADFCAQTCARDEECPSGMLCLREPGGVSRCGYRGLRLGRFAGACTSHADCNGFGCGSYGAGDEQSCRCFVPCSALAVPDQPSASEEGCAVRRPHSTNSLFSPLVLLLAITVGIRRRSGS